MCVCVYTIICLYCVHVCAYTESYVYIVWMYVPIQNHMSILCACMCLYRIICLYCVHVCAYTESYVYIVCMYVPIQNHLKQESDFSNFVRSTESRPECCGLRLSSLLITPVQRVPRSVAHSHTRAFIYIQALTHKHIHTCITNG